MSFHDQASEESEHIGSQIIDAPSHIVVNFEEESLSLGRGCCRG
jgi:hypothetical protein